MAIYGVKVDFVNRLYTELDIMQLTLQLYGYLNSSGQIVNWEEFKISAKEFTEYKIPIFLQYLDNKYYLYLGHEEEIPTESGKGIIVKSDGRRNTSIGTCLEKIYEMLEELGNG